MSKLFQKRFRVLVLVAFLLILMTAAYGFAALNTVPVTYAGEGNGLIDGYVVSNVHYVLDGTDPNDFDSVSFTLNQSAQTLRVGMSGGGAPVWLAAGDCTISSGTSVTCDLSGIGITVQAADGLYVAAAQ